MPFGMLQGPDLAINHPEAVLSSMNAWSQEHHDRSGLTQKCRDSTVTVQVPYPETCKATCACRRDIELHNHVGL